MEWNMSTPFEDLEFIADYLPDEGESVVVSRRNGELVCQSVSATNGQEGISDAELYGRLVLANERLGRLSVVPVWICLLGAFALCVAFFHLSQVGWQGWYVAVGVAAITALLGSTWVAILRARLFRREIVPMLDNQMRRRGFNRFALVGAIRQHPELGALLTELARGIEK